MQAAGAQRVMAQLVNHLAGRGHDVSLVTFEEAGDPTFFELADGVRRIRLGRQPEGPRLNRLRRLARWISGIRRAIRQIKPDVVLSFIDLTNVMTLLATRGLGVSVVVSERIDPHHHPIGPTGNILRRMTYPRAKRIVVQTSRAARFFADAPPSQCVTLANPVPPAKLKAQVAIANNLGRWRILGLGRLNRQKGFDLLIPAFARIAARNPDWDVAIFGQGPEQSALQAEIDRAGLSGRITLNPPTHAVAEELAAAHIFAFPSRYEGFPNALAEAMAAGLPAVAFADVSGVEDLIAHGASGLLAEWGAAPDTAIQAFTTHLAALMANPDLRQQLGEAAVHRTEAFEPQRMLSEWEEMIAQVVETGGNNLQ